MLRDAPLVLYAAICGVYFAVAYGSDDFETQEKSDNFWRDAYYALYGLGTIVAGVLIVAAMLKILATLMKCKWKLNRPWSSHWIVFFYSFIYFPIPLHILDNVAAALGGGALGSLSFTNLDFNIRLIRLILSWSFPKMLSYSSICVTTLNILNILKLINMELPSFP